MKTILVVEDTELNIDLITQLLEDDHNLIIAKDLIKGISMAHHRLLQPRHVRAMPAVPIT